MGSFKVSLYEVASNLWATFAVILFIAGHILLGWLWCLIFLTRLFAVFTAKSNSKIGKPLSWLDMVLWENYEIEHRGSMLALFYLDGDITLNKLKQLFQDNVLNARLNNDPDSPLRYPEMQQFQTTLLDFRFWKKDPNFCIDNHIREVCLDGCPGDEHDALQNFLENEVGKPFRAKSSPWTVNIVRNFPAENGNSLVTLLIFRVHHSLMDGLSFMSMLSSGLGRRRNVAKVKPKLLADISKAPPGIGLKKVAKLLQGFYAIQRRNFYNTIFWKWQSVTSGGTGKVILRSTKGLPLESIKKLAKKNEVMLPAFALSVVSHCLAKVRGISAPFMYAGYIMPLPNHPGNLTNHLQNGVIKLPLGIRDNLKFKMGEINGEIVDLKRSSTSMGLNYIGLLVGSMTSTMFTFMKNYAFFTPIAISNFAGDKDGFDVGGVPCSSLFGYLSPYNYAMDATIIISGYNDGIRISFAVDDRFLDRSQVSELANAVSEHLENMIRDELKIC